MVFQNRNRKKICDWCNKPIPKSLNKRNNFFRLCVRCHVEFLNICVMNWRLNFKNYLGEE